MFFLAENCVKHKSNIPTKTACAFIIITSKSSLFAELLLNLYLQGYYMIFLNPVPGFRLYSYNMA